jgi:hypothetical protein
VSGERGELSEGPVAVVGPTRTRRRDWTTTLVAVVARLMPARRREWGRAMQADLDQLESPSERREFALGCLRVAAGQPTLPTLACALAAEAVLARLAIGNLAASAFRTEVIALVLLAPPVLWLLGRRHGLLGAVGTSAACRFGRAAGYGLVGACLAGIVPFIGAQVLIKQDGAGAAQVCLLAVLVVLAGHVALVMAATSQRAHLAPSTIGLAGGLGAGAGLAGFGLLPFNQTLALPTPWGWAYPAVLGLLVVGAPALAAALATRRSGVEQGFCAALGTGIVAALVLFVLGLTTAWLHPALADSALIDKGVQWLPPDLITVAETYLAGLVLVPLGTLFVGAFVALAAEQTTSRHLIPALVLVTAVALGYPAAKVLDGRDHSSFGIVGTTSVMFAAGRPALLTSNGDMVDILWDVSRPGHPVRVATFQGYAMFSPDGRTLATQNRLWDVANPARPVRVGSFSGGDPVALTGTVLAALSGNRYSLWDVEDRAHPALLARVSATGVDGAGNVGALSANGRVFASTDIDATTTTLWRVADPAHPVTIATKSGWGNGGPVLSPDGSMVAVRSDDGTASVWSLADFQHPQRLVTVGSSTRDAAALVWTPDGRGLAVGSSDGTVTLWRLAAPVRSLAVLPSARPEPNTQIGASDTLTVVAISADGRSLATVAGNGLVARWDISDPVHPRRTAIFSRDDSGPGVVAFSRDLSALGGAAGIGRNSVTIWALR